MIDEKIKNFGNLFLDRLPVDLIEIALAYVDFSENVLAFETLCDYLGEAGIRVSEEEYREVLSIVEYYNLSLDDRYLFISPRYDA